MPKRSLGQHLDIWDRLAAAVSNNIRDIPAARQNLEILKRALAEIRKLKQRQVELRAAAQQATRDLEAAMEKASQAAVQLNAGVLATYGSQDEKLREYGLRPWRPRRRKAVPEGSQAGESAAPAEKKPRKPRRRPKS